MKLLYLFCVISCVLDTRYVLGAPDNRGTEFVIGYMDNYDMGGVYYDLELFVTTSRTTTVNVRVKCPKYGNLDKSFTVTSGYVEKLAFSYTYRVTGSRTESKGILVTADDEVVIYGVNKQKYSNDAFLGLPTDVLGKEYYAITYYPPYRRAQIMVVGVHDSTSVSIKFPSGSWAKTTDSYNGRTYSKGSTLNINLNRYDTFQIQSAGDLTGAYITANKAISVFSGNRKTNTGSYGSQDHLVEHLTPVNTWGSKFATVPIPKRSFGDYFKVVASEDNTKITYKCKKSNSISTSSITLSKAGDSKQVSVASNKYCYWSAEKAILLTQIVLSQKDSSEPADPALLIIPPIEQYAADYTFTTPKYSGGSYDNYFLFIVKKSEKSGLKVDGSSFPGNTNYVDIPDTDYVGGYINVADGSHTVRHDSPISVFGGFLYGRANLETYGFPTGMRMAGINEPCVPTTTVVGDGIDNDCDGLIDEELCTTENNRKDDDNDGRVEEDCATPPPIDGNWASWQSWSACSVTCTSGRRSTGSQTRSRTCSDPAPKYDGKQCVGYNTGADSQTQSCSTTTKCPINGGWGNWGSWGSCSVTCASGTQTRSRSCNNPTAQYGGTPCSGQTTETKSCTKSACPIDGKWSNWGSWTTCTKTCGTGSQKRYRSCNNPAPQHNGKSCSGDDSEKQNCNTQSCAVDGNWASWSSWGTCSVTCGGGSKTKTRSCSNPAPANGGKSCSGSGSESTGCNSNNCPIDGGFSAWTAWGTCTLTCGGGFQVKTRSCSNPAPKYGGKDCTGSVFESQTCNSNSCPIDGKWASWSSWGTCSLTCGGGSQSRSRTCTNPSPRHGGKTCSGDSTENQACNTAFCAIDGGFSAWSSWGTCSLTCGGGSQTKTRTCTNPTPRYGGKDCSGDTSTTQSCNTHSCPIDGGFSAWTAWGTCTLTCGGGFQVKTRSCTNPAPKYGGKDCSGSLTATQNCNSHNCPIDGEWANWSSWGTCTLTCGSGSQTKTRTCTNPSPRYNGADCPGDSSATQSCNTHNCPIDGEWTSWSSWGTCTLTCGSGSQTKTRTCTNPPPQYNGADCPGDSSLTQNCNTHNCPIDGEWNTWTAWGTCSLTCGGGSQSRSRECTNPPPQYNGADCVGSPSSTQACNTHNCPIDGEWTTWSSWATCSLTCGGGLQSRSRSCSDPPPQYNGADCVGTSFGMQSCNTHNCPIDGNWATWTSWTTCTVTCGGGSQSRSRTCTDPIPQYNGADCSGSGSATQSCNTHNCPIDGDWTSWGSWGSCTVTCGGGTMDRQRTCTNPAPQYGGADCSGTGTESTSCNTQVCIIDGAWSTWNAWGDCTATCGGGYMSRYRECTDPAPANGGLDCAGDQSSYTLCNTQACPTVAAGTYQQLCPTGWFTCAGGTMSCIQYAFVCDCDYDCDDGSDENVTYAGCNPILAEKCRNSAPGQVPVSIMTIIVCVLIACILLQGNEH